MILSTLVTSQLHFEMCAGLYGHPVYSRRILFKFPIETGMYSEQRFLYVRRVML